MARTDDAPGDRFERGHATVPTAEYPALGAAGNDDPTGADHPDTGVGQPSAPPPAASVGSRLGGGPFRGLFWLVATIALIFALLAGTRMVGLWPSLSNPFANRQTDRSQPVVLKSIQDLSRFVAAEGNFEVIIDVEENRQYIPEFLLGQRTLFVAAGTVEAYVDFGGIGEGAIVESDDRKTVEIKLPAPALGKPNIDNQRSYVFATQRGLLNRIGDAFKDDPNRLNNVYRLAEEKIAASATGSGLPDRAKENTRKMLEGMLRSLGYTSVTVTFAAP